LDEEKSKHDGLVWLTKIILAQHYPEDAEIGTKALHRVVPAVD
jgi:hypothetical protein